MVGLNPGGRPDGRNHIRHIRQFARLAFLKIIMQGHAIALDTHVPGKMLQSRLRIPLQPPRGDYRIMPSGCARERVWLRMRRLSGSTPMHSAEPDPLCTAMKHVTACRRDHGAARDWCKNVSPYSG